MSYIPDGWYEDAEGSLMPASPEAWDELCDDGEASEREELKRPRCPKIGSKRYYAEQFLLRELAAGARLAKELVKIALAQKLGTTNRSAYNQITYAAEGLFIRKFEDDNADWWWRLPTKQELDELFGYRVDIGADGDLVFRIEKELAELGSGSVA